MASNEGTFGITGIPPPKNVEFKTDHANNIPYVTGMPLRYEVTQFFEKMMSGKDATMRKQWTLFVEGLRRFKALSVEEKLSYFQVAGIHGSPQQPWDGAKPPNPTPVKPAPGQNPEGGYCHHNTIAFPTWHRPYMLLYEQCIWLNMHDVIDEWVNNKDLAEADKDSWKAAAETWRLFYWDWARAQSYPKEGNLAVESWNDYGIPYLFATEQVPIFLPAGDKVVANPLWNFENPEKDPVTKKPFPFGKMPEEKKRYNIPNGSFDPEKGEIPLPWGECSATSRWGILYDAKTKSYSGLEGINDWKNCNTALATAGVRQYIPRRGRDENDKIPGEKWPVIRPKNLADAVNRMFSYDYNGTWSAFASTKWYAEKQTDLLTGYLSLEYIHNNIHNITGGSSLGLGINEQGPDPSGIYGSGQMCDVPVAAFDPIFWMHHCNIDRYTAMWQCLNWEKWFEPEPPAPPGQETNVEDVKPDTPLLPFHRKDGGDPNDKSNQWTSETARDWTLHGYQYDDLMPTSDAVGSNGKLIPSIYKQDLQAYIHKTYQGTSYEAWDIRAAPDIVNEDFFGEKTTAQRSYEDYIINVVYDRYALNGKSYAIDFSIGDEYVGQIYSLGGMKAGTEIGCANCGNQRDAQILSKGQVPIAIPLMQLAADRAYTDLQTIRAEPIEQFLAQNLKWEFVQAGGQVRPASDFPNTTITVWGGKAIWSQDKRDGGDIWRPPFYKTESYRPLYKATENKEGGASAPSAESDLPAPFADVAPLDDYDMPTQAPAA